MEFEAIDTDFYLKDATAHLLRLKITGNHIPIFYKHYFQAVKKGTHVVFREYSYISGSYYNRICFIRSLYDTFLNLTHKSLHISECHSIVRFLCPDFLVSLTDSVTTFFVFNQNQPLVRFGDFLYALQAEFCFSEFLRDARLISAQKDMLLDESAGAIEQEKFMDALITMVQKKKKKKT